MMVNTQLQSMSLNLATGIDAYILESVRLYPNPVGESLKVEGIQGGTQARIYSSDGRLQQHHMLESVLEEIDVSELPAGFYILKLEKGQASARKRFVKR